MAMNLNGRITKLEKKTKDVPGAILKLRRLIAEGKITKEQVAERWPNVARDWL